VVTVVHVDGIRRESGVIVWGFCAMSRRKGGSLNLYHWDKEEANIGTAALAEYMALASALQWVLSSCGGEVVEVYTSSSVLVGQTSGQLRVRSRSLVPWYSHIMALLGECAKVGTVVQVRRIGIKDNMAHSLVVEDVDYDEQYDRLAEVASSGDYNRNLSNELESE
jgi:ribonuclease HI